MSRTLHKQVATELNKLGMADGCKVSQSRYTEVFGYVEIERGVCHVRFDLRKVGRQWIGLYTAAQMAELFVAACLSAAHQSRQHHALSLLIGNGKDGEPLQPIGHCYLKFELTRRLSCSFRSPEARALFCNRNNISYFAPHPADWDAWEKESILAVHNIERDVQKATQSIRHLIYQGKQTLLMRLLGNVMGVAEAQADWVGVAVIPEVTK